MLGSGFLLGELCGPPKIRKSSFSIPSRQLENGYRETVGYDWQMLTAAIRRMECPACASQETFQFCSAVISPWVAELAHETKSHGVEIKQCENCSTVFCDFGYEKNVLNALYKDYRGRRYQSVRQSWEPGYTNALNSALNGSPEWMKNRQQDVLNSLIASKINLSDIQTCVDFGGGHGGVMPDFKYKYVFEENLQVQNSEKINVIADWADVKKLQPDLIMCCGVLEHVNQPKSLVQLLKTSGARFYYFEVPSGTPLKRVGFFSKSWALNIAVSSKPLWRSLQSLERAIGNKRLRRFFPFRVSEHLQFFSEKGIRNLISNSGLKVLNVTTQNHSAGLEDSRNMAFGSTLGIVATL